MLKEKNTVDRATVQRVERGWILANLGKVEKDGPLYNVRSSTGRGMYVVDLRSDSCNCPDWKIHGNGHICKHIFSAVIFNAKS